MTVEDAHDLAVLRSNCLAGLVTLSEFARSAAGIAAGSPTPWSAASSWSGLAVARRWAIGTFRSVRRRVVGLTPPTVRAVSVLGVLRVDLAEARLLGDGLQVTAVAVLGVVEVVVPAGLAVEVSGAGTSGADVPLPGAPSIRVRGVPIFGRVRVRRS